MERESLEEPPPRRKVTLKEGKSFGPRLQRAMTIKPNFAKINIAYTLPAYALALGNILKGKGVVLCYFLLIVLLFFGCQAVTIPPKVNLAGLRLGVFPLSGVSTAPGIESEFQVKLLNRLSAIPGIVLIDQGVVNQVLSKQTIIISLPGGPKPEQIINLSENLKAELIMLGGITSYYETFHWERPLRSGRLFKPQEKYWSVSQITTVYLSGTLRLVDGKSGKIIWMALDKVEYRDAYLLELPWDGNNPNPPPQTIYGPFNTSRVIRAREMAVNHLVERLTRDFFYRRGLR